MPSQSSLSPPVVPGLRSAPSSPTPERQPPTGPKAWLENQSRGLARANSNSHQHPPSTLQQHGQRAGNGRHRPFQLGRTATPPPRRPAPWQGGDAIIFASPGSPHVRSFSSGNLHPHPRVQEQSPSPPTAHVYTPPKRKGRKSTASPSLHRSRSVASSVSSNAFVDDASDVALRIRELERSMQGNLLQLQAELAGILEKPFASATPGGETVALVAMIGEHAKNMGNVAQSFVQSWEPTMAMDNQSTIGYPALPVSSRNAAGKLKNKDDKRFEPSFTTFSTYRIPPEVMELKTKLKDDNPLKFWSHVYYTNDDGQKVQIQYCKTIERCETVLQHFLSQKVVGFDMEWCIDPDTMAARKNVCMIQFASESAIAIIHIAQMETDSAEPSTDDETKLVSPSLRALIETPDILKVGVNILGDARRLRDFLSLKPCGIFELSDLHHSVVSAETKATKIPKKLISLARLTQTHLLLPLSKGSVRRSDWSLPIDEEQAGYAAADAYAGLRIFDVLHKRRALLYPVPPFPQCRPVPEYSGDPPPEHPRPPPPVKPAPNSLAATANPIAPGVLRTDNLAQALANTEIKAGDGRAESTMKAAESWLITYRANHYDTTATRSQLRAYALWHEFGHEIETVCRLWRDPPLKKGTIATYILECIRLEKLPYDRQRLRTVVGLQPASIADKWMWMVADGKPPLM